MARRWIPALLCLLLLACGLRASAQTGIGQPVGPGKSGPAESVILGQSMVPLNGPWKFQVGDSPVEPGTGKPVWARPDFDDASWETVDLTPKGAANLFQGLSGYVTGWGDKGHPAYWGYAWYRMRVKIRPQPGEDLAIAGPANVDDAYQLFLDGALSGSFGRFNGERPDYYYTQPTVFALPEAAGTQTIAFRVWMSPVSLLGGRVAGGIHLAPVVGAAPYVNAAYQLRWLDLIRYNAVWALFGIGGTLLALVALGLFLVNRKDQVYLWMGMLFLATGLGAGEFALGAWTRSITATAEMWICYVILVPCGRLAWIMMLRAWFGLERPRWLPWAGVMLSLLSALAFAGELDLLFPLVPSTAVPMFFVLSEVLTGVFEVVMIWLVVRGIREFGREGWLLLPASLLGAGSWLVGRLTSLHGPTQFSEFGVWVSLDQITLLLLVLGLCALLIRRWVLSALAQRQMTLEMKQAQEVQKVLIPEAVTHIPGFSIESVYEPAGQVGGDFFQIMPAPRGGVLLCIGDVSGKGMPAAMTVSLLVGTLRTLAHYTQSPGEILAGMNQRILGRSRGGFTTCLILLVAADGTVTVANAGHISPYLKGREVALENGLPLGLVAESTYAESTFYLEENEQMTLMTDGVVEARSASGELFGFERSAAVAALSAAQISKTAQAFGQDDDITVLTLTRLTVEKLAPGPQNATVLSPSLA